MVLCGGPRERHPPNVDELLEVIGARVVGQVPFERVEVDRHEVKREEAPLGELLSAGLGPRGEDPPQEARMQGLDPSPEPRRDAGELLGRTHGDVVLGERPAGPAGRPQLDPEVGEPARERAEA